MSTGIEWTDEVWNPMTGCTPISPGCQHCYARGFARRLAGRAGYEKAYPFLPRLRPDRLAQPLHWRRRRRIFFCSMGDLFHEQVPDSYIAAVMGMVAVCGSHSFIALTKRPARMRRWFRDYTPGLCRAELLSGRHGRYALEAAGWNDRNADSIIEHGAMVNTWPLPNLTLGISAENQQWLESRLPPLLCTPAAHRLISFEPLLGPVSPQLMPDGRNCIICGDNGHQAWECHHTNRAVPDWIIVGGETGPGARPMHPVWVRALRDQSIWSHTAFFFKSWGAWRPAEERGPTGWNLPPDHKPRRHSFPDGWETYRVGAQAAGRQLDGKTWDQQPQGL